MKLFLLVVLVALAAPGVAAAAPSPVAWCGTDEATANRVPDLEVASKDQIRFVYAVPSDAPDNFFANASGIATDAAWIAQWWEEQDPTRTPRIDRYPFPGCTSTYGATDIGFIRLPSRAAIYMLENTPAGRLDRDLGPLLPKTQKTIVYFDSPIESTSTCGETDDLSDDEGGARGIVYVFMQSCSLGPPGSGGTAEVAAHELLHNLGAVPDGAPHVCPTSANHVCDSAVDVMYPLLGSGSTLDAVSLDVGRDDYYGHSGPQWDVQDSGWLTHLPQFPFSVAVQGSGTLDVHAGTTAPSCRTGCDALQLDDGETVAATATPASGWVFAAWSGACAGKSRTCTLSVGAPTSAVATFAKARTQIGASVRGRGRIVSSPSGIDCPGTCRAGFASVGVRLRAIPERGWSLAGWSGACDGRTTCRVSGAVAVRARFVRG